MLRTESEHDCYGAGHAGTALSAALGMAAGRDQRGGDENIVCVAGDAAFTCGVSYEALNNVAETTKRLIVVLNDNEWSIAKNVGAMAGYFNRIATIRPTSTCTRKASRFIQMIGGRDVLKMAGKVEAGLKNVLLPSVLFEDLGLRYYGPIDGHDTALLIRTFEFLKTQDEPVILHILTKKGKGYSPALEAAGQVPRPGQVQARNRRDRHRLRCRRTRKSRRHARQLRRQQREDRRHHRRHAQRAPASSVSRSGTRRSITTWASPRNTRRCSRAGWRCRA